jgi:hypothetical protein
MAATDHDELVTEAGGGSADIDLLNSHELVELMNDEDETVAPAVRAASAQIAEVIDAAAGWSTSVREPPERSLNWTLPSARRPSLFLHPR